jgi:(R,R)-butanediol dehydrogenase / meso-butanediol dehydrogenase / diacetyl reductase
MKAAYFQGNSSFSIGDCIPEPPNTGEVRIDVSHCGICGTDLHIYRGHMAERLTLPQVIGHEMSGIIAEIGAGVEGFGVGDPVVVRPLDPCGDCPACRAGHSHICQNLNFMGINSPGAFQASWTVPAKTLHKLPQNLDMKLAALIEPLAVACHDVRMGQIQSGENVVVIGGGPIGMLVSLVAQSKGAAVTLSELNPFRLNLAKELGLNPINPTELDIIGYIEEQTGGAGADAVFEVSGSKAGAEVMTEICRARGRIIVVAIFPEPEPVNLFKFFWRELRMFGTRVYEPEDYEEAIALAASGRLPLEKLVTGVQPLDELPEAFRELDTSPNHLKILIDCVTP